MATFLKVWEENLGKYFSRVRLLPKEYNELCFDNILNSGKRQGEDGEVALENESNLGKFLKSKHSGITKAPVTQDSPPRSRRGNVSVSTCRRDFIGLKQRR
jgi:hypothetical protein